MIEQCNSLKVNAVEAFKVEVRYPFMCFWSYPNVASVYGTDDIWEFPDIKQH